jgi:catalase
MAAVNPATRVNYEPNSWGGEAGGPRESPTAGFHSFPADESGPKIRIRADKFADHYSQARQFYMSQTRPEQDHIAAAFTFELSKVETPAIRARMVGHLLNVDKGLAEKVADGLGIRKLPQPANAAMAPRTDLKASPALSILRNGSESFAGRRVGALVTQGFNAELLNGLKGLLEQEGTALEVIAPTAGEIEASDGSQVQVGQRIDGGPSVLYDAVALLPSRSGGELMAREPAAQDFVADAFAHSKFIAYVEAAMPLLDKVIGRENLDAGLIEVGKSGDFIRFIDSCRKFRFWERTAGKPDNSGQRSGHR